MQTSDPTPEEIDQMTAQIRSTWSELEHRQRACCYNSSRFAKGLTHAQVAAMFYWTPPECSERLPPPSTRDAAQDATGEDRTTSEPEK